MTIINKNILLPFAFMPLFFMFASCSDNVTRNYANLSRPESTAFVPSSYERPARLYIANPPENVLKVFNLSGSSASPMVGPVGFFPLEIPVGKFPQIVKATADGQFILAYNEITRDISLVSVDKNLEIDVFPASPASQHVTGVARRQSVTRLEFQNESGENIQVADIHVMRYGEPLGAEPSENEKAAYLTSKAIQSRVIFSLPEEGVVKTYIFDPTLLQSGKSPFIEEYTFEFDEFRPGLVRASQNSEFLWLSDVSKPLLARVQIKELNWDDEKIESTGGESEYFIGRTDTVELPGSVFDMEVIPPRAYTGGAYWDRLYVLDRENAYIYIVTAETLQLKEPYPRRYEVGKPGISPGNLAVADLVMTDFYRPYYYESTSGCEAQTAFVLSTSGALFGIDIGGCYPFIDGFEEPLTRHKPHHLIDVNPIEAEIDMPAVVMPQDSIVELPTETAPMIIGQEDEENNYGVMVSDGQSYTQMVHITYKGEIPPHWEAPGVFTATANIDGVVVNFTDDDIDLTLSGVEIGDKLYANTFTIITAESEEGGGDDDDTISNPNRIEECPAAVITAITKNSLEIDAPFSERCQGESIAVSIRANDGWVVRGAYTGYMGRQYEDGVYRPFPNGPGGYIVKFAMEPAQSDFDRIEDMQIVFNLKSNISLLKIDAAGSTGGAATLPSATVTGRHYPGAPLMLYVVFSGSEVVAPVNLELYDLFSDSFFQ